MSEPGVINPAALEPLFKPWEEPNAHRIQQDGAKTTVKGRLATSIVIAQNLRAVVREWREGFYLGASDTTRRLFEYWFDRSHRKKTPAGDEFDFRYYFCQREAIETFVFLREIRKCTCLSQIVADFGGPEAEIAALGITEKDDAWSRIAFKLATGAGKTKCMSLAMVWSYFHALRESESEMARHFVVIAPGLTVYERLKQDFKPEGGGPDIFDYDPLIPSEWKGDWNLSVVLQGEAGGASTGGTLYLTNIQRLHDTSKRKGAGGETYPWMGPSVSKAKALDTSAALRDRITAHARVMLFNDEAHHVWDPDSAWNEAIAFLHDTIKARTGGGLAAQLDFSATPKDNSGNVFKHVVCDTPLGEAVDAGIIKTPIIAAIGQKIQETASDNAAVRYERHLRLGYERWKLSRAEWQKSDKKALLFVMCEDTKAADQITLALNGDESFKELNGFTVNLHTNLKGKIKKEGSGANAREVFVESENDISEDDLKALRKLSRELDENKSPFRCIVSVLMLREGWDVKNVTTIVPLRPYSSKAGILPEQTLGRGLRRMTPPGQANELVAVVDHPAFTSLYQQELAKDGLFPEIVDIDKVPTTTVSIFPDPKKPDFDKLEVMLPQLSGGFTTLPKVEGLTIADVKAQFKNYAPLPLGSAGPTEIQYEGRHLITKEVVERFTLNIPIMATGVGAISYYVKQLEHICSVTALHSTIAPLLETFLAEILFEKKTDLYDPALVSRLGNPDVCEHIFAVFLPLIRSRTIKTEKRIPGVNATPLSKWRPFQVTHSERRPTLPAKRTPFNLTPCANSFEQVMAQFADHAPDVAAFAKNAEPQCLRVDYLAAGNRLAFYTPDFFARKTDGHYFLIETKGKEDVEVPRKARAAKAWCEAASTPQCKWEYVYVSQGVFERLTGDTIAELARTCAPALVNLLQEHEDRQQFPLFAVAAAEATKEIEKAPETKSFVDEATLNALPSRYRKAVTDAVEYFQFARNKSGLSFSPVFQPLLGSLDEAAKGLIVKRLSKLLPATVPEQKAWFEPYLSSVDQRMVQHYKGMAQNLKKTLVFNNGISLIGLLRNCLDFAMNDKNKPGGVFDAVQATFKVKGALDLLDKVTKINDFRNNYVAHQSEGKQLTDAGIAEKNLKDWIDGLKRITETE